MDGTGAGLVAVTILLLVFGVKAFLNGRRVKESENWPTTTATIQSAAMEEVASGRSSVVLPCFAFSYVINGEYYSGRFALYAKGSQGEDLVTQLVDRKIEIRIDPEAPSTFYIPDETIEGYEVEQKLGMLLYPKE